MAGKIPEPFRALLITAARPRLELGREFTLKVMAAISRIERSRFSRVRNAVQRVKGHRV